MCDNFRESYVVIGTFVRRANNDRIVTDFQKCKLRKISFWNSVLSGSEKKKNVIVVCVVGT